MEIAPVILLSGPPGAGKSTLAKELVAISTNRRMANIEGDQFWFYAPKTDLDRRSFHSVIVGAMLSAAMAYARSGHETIVDFTIGPWDLPPARLLLRGAPVDLVLLVPSLAVCERRAAGRTEGAMPDYAPYRELHEAFALAPMMDRFRICDDGEDVSALARRLRADLDAGKFRLRDPASGPA